MQFHAGRVVIGPLAVLADSHVAGGDALDRPVLVEQHLGCREARIDLDPQRLGLGRHPPRHLTDADDVVALVVHRRRRRKFVGLRLRQEQEEVLGRRDLDRSVAVTPVGDQLVECPRLQHRSRQQVGADLGPLLDHAHRDLATALVGQLLQADGGGQAGWSRAHDHDVVLHHFTNGVHVTYPKSGRIPAGIRPQLRTPYRED